MAPDPLDKNRNWVRVAMGLKYLKEGLESLVDDEIVKLQKSFLQDIRKLHGLLPTITCSLCNLENVLPREMKKYCKKQRPRCQNNLCNNIAAEIVGQHQYTHRTTDGSALKYDAPSWGNTDVSKWCTSPWEIAKCFMPPSGYTDKLTAKETDCTGILSVIINCQAIRSALSIVIDPKNDIFSKIRKIRNTIMHSATLEVTDADLQQYIDDMLAILNASKTIQKHQDAVDARTKLNQIKANTFVISARDELELRKKAVEAIEQKQKELKDQCQQVQLDIETKANQTLASLSHAGISCQKKLEEIREEVELKSKQTQSTVDQKMNSLTQTHAIIEQNQNDLQSKCDQTMTTLAQAEIQCQQKQDDIQSSLTSLQAQMKQVIEDLRQCQQDITEVRDLQKGTDKHKEQVKILENVLEQRQLLQTRLREKYKRQQSTIPLSPFLKNLDDDIEKVYQQLVIRPDLIHDPHVKQLNQRYFSINSFKDIFHNQEKTNKNIFVVGNGGVGKTTWCLKLLNTWLNCKTNKDKDSIFLKRFEYLFYVQLRHTKQSSQIIDMVRSYIFPKLDERCFMDTVNDVLLNKPEKCLIILDGLDEWNLPSEQSMLKNGLPYDPTNSKYTTLITSRPWKLELLRLESSSIDIAVEIEGLDDEGMFRFAGHLIDKLNSVRNEHKNIGVFTDCIKGRKLPMIGVPLMLSIFVYLWYENDFIGDTLAELYSKVTEGLLNYAEGDERKINHNLEVSKLSDIKYIPELKKTWSNQKMSLLECLNNVLCKTYYPLIYKIGQLAFNGLLSDNRENTLIFTQKSIKEYINAKELEIVLCVGILSQSQTIGDITEETFSISFMHKILQEFCAAAYIVSATSHDAKCNIKSKVVSYCEKIQNVFEIENILMFICGMDPKLAGKLTEQISLKHNNDVIGSISGGRGSEKNLHKVLLRCVREEHLYSNESNQVYIINHFIEPGDRYVRAEQTSINTETFSYIKQNCNRIPMCLYIKCTGKKDDTKFEDFICKSFSGVQTLDKLKIRLSMNLYDSKGCLRVFESIKHLQLQTLQIDQIAGNLGDVDLSNLSNLEYLSMISIEIEELSLPLDGRLKNVKLKCEHSLHGAKGCLTRGINNQPNLKSLTLDGIVVHGGHVDMSYMLKLKFISMTSIQVECISLPKHGCLKTVELKCIKHPQGAPGRLTFNMNNQPHIESLTLEDIIGNIGNIDLSNYLNVRFLTLASIEIEKLSLPQDGCLQRVELVCIKHPQGAPGRLTFNMNNQQDIELLTLNDIIGNIGHIDLSNNSKMRSLSMTSIQIEELSLPQDGWLDKVALKSIKHPRGAQERLKLNMNTQPYIKNLTLEDIKGNIGHINLSNNSNLESLSMTSIQIEELSLPHNGCLKEVELKCIKHSHGAPGKLKLTMDNQRSLYKLTLEDILGNCDHFDLSNNSKLVYLSMASIQIEELTLPQDGYLRTVELRCIKHPNGAQGKLALTINNQRSLHSLLLNDIQCNIGHINLSNIPMLWYLSMVSIQIEEFSLPQQGCLNTIELKYIKHPHTAPAKLKLNIKNQHNLQRLTLVDIQCNIGHIDMSKNTNLTDVTVKSVPLMSITVPPGVTIKSKDVEYLTPIRKQKDNNKP